MLELVEIAAFESFAQLGQDIVVAHLDRAEHSARDNAPSGGLLAQGSIRTSRSEGDARSVAPAPFRRAPPPDALDGWLVDVSDR